MIDVTPDLLMLIIAVSLVIGTEPGWKGGWSGALWLVARLFGVALVVAYVVLDYRLRIPGDKSLALLVHIGPLLLLGIGLWCHIRRDAARLRARREVP